MSENRDEASGSVLDDLGFDLVSDLERQSADNIRKLRAHERIELRLGVVVRPGNSSEVARFAARGKSVDISEGGMCVLLPTPLTPGDIYRVEFEDDDVDLPLVFARCLRSRFVREGTFEAGVSFFNKVPLNGIWVKGE